MPLASSNDLILAGIQDILHALHYPSPGSPLAPLSDSHHAVLIQLTSILTSVAQPSCVHTPPDNDSDSTTDPSLRVVPNSNILHNTVQAPPPDTPLRVPAVRRPAKGVTFAPLPAPIGGATFGNSTGAPGKQRRRLRRQSTPSSVARPAKTMHPSCRLPPPHEL
jgi:hypothetical protein